jgi:chromosome segregation ATPase
MIDEISVQLKARAETAERELEAANANHRAMASQLADMGRKLAEAREALRPLARLEVPKRPQGNAGAYSIYHNDIRAARAITGKE